MRKKNMKKLVIRAMVILTIIFVWLVFNSVKFKVNKEHNALLMKNMDNGTAEEIKIKIQGHYYFNLFKNDRFYGKIIIDGFNETTYKEVDLNIRNGIAGLVYREWRGNSLQSEEFGIISTDIGMDKIMIFVSEDGLIKLGTNDICFISSSAKDKADMNKKYNQFQNEIINWLD